MKHIVLIFAVLFTLSCKKKKVEPAPVDPVPVCQTGLVKFAGKYVYQLGNKDTIEVVFISNRCPATNSNNYIVKGLGKAIQPSLIAGQSFEIKDYNIISDELNNNAKDGDKFTFFTVGQNELHLSCAKLTSGNHLFIRK